MTYHLSFSINFINNKCLLVEQGCSLKLISIDLGLQKNTLQWINENKKNILSPNYVKPITNNHGRKSTVNGAQLYMDIFLDYVIELHPKHEWNY